MSPLEGFAGGEREGGCKSGKQYGLKDPRVRPFPGGFSEELVLHFPPKATSLSSVNTSHVNHFLPLTDCVF